MFGFRKARPAPALCPANPGIGVEAKVAFSRGDRSWTEKIDAVRLAAAAFEKHGYSVRNEKTWLLHEESGFMIQPQIVGLQPLDNGGVQTVSTVQTNHPALVPDGLFEFQHSTGDTSADSLSQGFDQWVQTDFLPLLEASRPDPGDCMVLEMAFPAVNGKPPRTRRAVLGPVAHLRHDPQAAEEERAPEEHPFCPCCLLTNTFEAFKGLVEDDGFYGIRLFALRDLEGVPQADCRVNGEDWEPGMQALREYAATWPAAGYEFRKQYVVLQSVAPRP